MVNIKNDSRQVCVGVPENEGRQNTVFFILNASVTEEKRGVLWRQIYNPGSYAAKRGECLQIPVSLAEPGTYTVIFSSATTPSVQGENKKIWTRQFQTKLDETSKPVLTMIN